MTDEHCKDCCCAKAWEALGITGYTGKSIPEEIDTLTARLASAEARLRKYEPESDKCEHGVAEGDWCEPCNREYKEAAKGERHE